MFIGGNEMKNIRVGIILLLFASLITIQTQNYLIRPEDTNLTTPLNSQNKVSQTSFYKVDIQITSPTGYSMPGYTPIVINLSSLANAFPSSADPFGTDTEDTSDDIKWPAAFVILNNSLIPSQVDNVDGQIGYTAGDELVFQFPENLNLESDETATFSVYFGTEEADLPEPVYQEECIIYEYPDYDEVAENFGSDMLGEAYYIENGLIRGCPLIDAAWSSGGLYHLSILDEEGNSQWDAVKQRFQNTFENWKWARFATVEQFIELNDKAGSNPFFLPDPQNSIITGPVRARIQMKSVPPYGKPASVWGTKPGVYGLVTYELYANNIYLDYTLDTTGPNAAQFPTLMIELQNREKAPGGAYSPYKWFYVPGKGYVKRVPDDLKTYGVQASEISQSWYVEKLKPGETMIPDEPDADKLGFGVIFDKTGLDNLTYEKTSEDIKLVYSAAQMPLHARYHPFDSTITDNAISFMGQNYAEWSRPDPTYIISTTETQDLPFDYISVSKPEVYPAWVKVGNQLNITNITAISSNIGEITGNTTGTTHTYEIIHENTSQVVLTGDLEWNINTSKWEAINKH
jgi:hypothetical protein